MIRFIILTILIFSLSSCQTQTQSEIPTSSKIVGGPCEGCEAVFEYGNKNLTSVDTLPEFKNNHPQLKLSGTVFQKDGKTPAHDVIVYIYHTDRKGIYPTNGNEKGWGKRHGYLRGWTKTGKDGKYTFYTFRPAAYPNGRESEHIHLTIKEPNKNEYYIDNVVFTDDPLLTKDKIQNLGNRGGSGIVTIHLQNEMQVVKRDIILGMNIPDYD
ncbi:MAG: intradiol ring-cleavage dioxygenase [Saprospiraceae bacterium]